MTSIAEQKATLRKALRKARREHAASLPPEVSALVFARPPEPVLRLVPPGATIGLYRADKGEAPAAAYARYFFEAGHTIALPRITSLASPMQFHRHIDPFHESDLQEGPMGLMQPAPEADLLEPDVLFMPLVGFTEQGDRIGQGGGFYDRWLAAHPQTLAIGMAWDVQRVDTLPLESHDAPLGAIITPTRIYGPF
jgi:5-formyltetrahydrofolate cyclo-ligase